MDAISKLARSALAIVCLSGCLVGCSGGTYTPEVEQNIGLYLSGRSELITPRVIKVAIEYEDGSSREVTDGARIALLSDAFAKSRQPSGTFVDPSGLPRTRVARIKLFFSDSTTSPWLPIENYPTLDLIDLSVPDSGVGGSSVYQLRGTMRWFSGLFEPTPRP